MGQHSRYRSIAVFSSVWSKDPTFARNKAADASLSLTLLFLHRLCRCCLVQLPFLIMFTCTVNSGKEWTRECESSSYVLGWGSVLGCRCWGCYFACTENHAFNLSCNIFVTVDFELRCSFAGVPVYATSQQRLQIKSYSVNILLERMTSDQ